MRAVFVPVLLVGLVATSVVSAQDAPPAEGAPAPDAAPAAEPAPAAEAAPAAPGEAAAPPAAAKPKKPPYSLPWQLRPVAPGNVARLDTSVLLTKPKGADSGGSAIASTLLVSYKVMDNFAPLLRLGYVTYSPPELPAPAPDPKSGSAFLNPVVGGLYGMALSPEMKLGLFLGVALPLGSNGGDEPKPEKGAALNAGMAARRYMDNAMFATNFATVFPGVGFAYVANGLTVQAEVTVLQMMRAKGKEVEKDSSKTNLTSGLHVGYFVIPMLSLGAELNYQRWLSTPKAPTGKPQIADQDHLRDNLSFAVGPRLHIQAGENLWLRPGIAYARFIDKPMGDSDKYDSNHIIQVDIPVAF